MKKATFTRVLAMLLCALMLFLAGCTAATTETSAETKNTESSEKIRDTINLQGSASAINPFDADTTANAVILMMTHDRLLEKNLKDEKPNEMVPGLATEWEWTGDTTLEMKLREGVTFHNGEAFNADDVLYTFERAKQGVSASKLEILDHVEAVDDYTVRFVLSKFNADFDFLLSETFTSICNREACEEDEAFGTWIGTGAYVVKEFIQSDSAKLERNENYWGELGITKTFNFRNIPETSTALMALENDEMDAVGFDVVDISHVEENPELDYHVRPGMFVYLTFNTTKGPGSDPNFRLAVAHALNIDDYLAVCGPGFSTASNTFWGPNTFGVDNSIEPYGHDIEKAKEYLAKSKYNEFTITTTGSVEFIAEVVQANCAEAGIKVNIETIDLGALTKKCAFDDPEHEATLGTLTWNTFGDDCRRFFYPGSNLNRAIVTDERLIELVDKAASITDEAEREGYYHEIQRINHDEAYYLPLCIGVGTGAYNVNLKGTRYDPRGRNDYRYIYRVDN